MESSSDYYLTKQEIELGIQVIKSKVLAFFNDAKILAENKGTPEHCVGLYLFGVEEFGKLLLLEDSLKANPVDDQYAVDRGIFAKSKDRKKNGQAHKLKFNRALQTLPWKSLNRSKSVIVKTALSKPFVFMSGTGPLSDVGEVPIPQGTTGTFSNTTTLIPSKFTVDERVEGFLVEWKDEARRWTSSEVQSEAGSLQISVATYDLLRIIDSAETFVKAYH